MKAAGDQSKEAIRRPTAEGDELRQRVSHCGLSRRMFGLAVNGPMPIRAILICPMEPGQTTSLPPRGLKNDAEELSGVPQSVLTPNGLPPNVRHEVLQQARPLWSSGSGSTCK
jgi:hypothetical protein